MLMPHLCTAREEVASHKRQIARNLTERKKRYAILLEIRYFND